jgi:phosphoenolpyruvate carboxykinase (GTP)
MGRDIPKDGVNFSGPWNEGKTDSDGNPIPPAHKNARYTVALQALSNVDPELESPIGVHLSGIMYGGRDARTYVPVQQSFSWEHGIIAYGASLETETTFATLGREGVSEINVMSIQDFLAIPVGKYILNNLNFAKDLKKPPLVFGVNYFLRGEDGKFLNEVRDKAVWVKWMELRVHGDVGARRGPTGRIPNYEDLQRLFQKTLGKDYRHEDYVQQFEIRIPQNLSKLDRVERFYHKQVTDAPDVLFKVLAEQRRRLLDVRKQFGDHVSPEKLPVE